MAYTDIDFKTKKELKATLASGKQVSCYQPGGIFPLRYPGSVTLEGPHYPKPHRWYATAELDSHGCIVPGTVR